jgi:GAF domain-containing protein
MSERDYPSRLSATERRHPRTVRRVAWLRAHHGFVAPVTAGGILVVLALDLFVFPGHSLAGLYLVPVALVAVSARERTVAGVAAMCGLLTVTVLVHQHAFTGENALVVVYGFLTGLALVGLSYLIDRLTGISTRATLRAQLAEATSDVLSMGNTRGDLEEMLQYVVERIGEQVDAASGIVLLLHGDEWGGLAGFGQGVDARAISYPFASVPAAVQALREDNVVELESLGGRPAAAPADGKDPGPQRVLVAPLRAFGHDIGVVAFSRPPEAGAYSAEQLRFAETVARYTAIAIENSRLMAELQERRHALELVRDSSLDFAASLDLAHVLEAVSMRLLDALDMESCDIFTFDVDTDMLRLSVSYAEGTFEHPEWAQWEGQLSAWAVPRLAVGSRQAVLVRDHDDRRLNEEERRLWEHYGHKTQLDLPLRTRDRVIGVVELFADGESRDLQDEDIELAQAICRFAAMAIENAKLFDTERSTAQHLDMLTRQLQQLQEISLDLSRQMRADPQQLLDETIRSGVNLLGARAGAVVTYEEGELQIKALHVLADWKPFGIGGAPPPPMPAVLRDPLLELSEMATKVLGTAYPRDPRGGRVEKLRPAPARDGALLVPLESDQLGPTASLIFSGVVAGYFSAEDELLATTLAAQLGASLGNALAYKREHEIADTLQTALLTEPPPVPGLDIGKRYRPATQATRVGGDFYDMVSLGPGRLMVAVGDVCGKGLQPAAHTAVVRYMLRAYAAESSPGESLSRLNTTVLTQAPQQPFVTMVVAYIDVVRHMIEYAVAGHPRPIILVAGREFPVAGVGGLPIGIQRGEIYPTNRAVLPEDAAIVFYTDGLVEALKDGKMYGEARLRKAIRARLDRGSRDIAEGLVETVRRYSGGLLSDDCAVVVVKMP